MRRADVPVRIRSSVVQIQVERPALSVIVGVAAVIGIALRIPSAIHISDSLPGISFRCAEHLTFHLRGWGRSVSPATAVAPPLMKVVCKKATRRRTSPHPKQRWTDPSRTPRSERHWRSRRRDRHNLSARYSSRVRHNSSWSLILPLSSGRTGCGRTSWSGYRFRLRSEVRRQSDTLHNPTRYC